MYVSAELEFQVSLPLVFRARSMSALVLDTGGRPK